MTKPNASQAERKPWGLQPALSSWVILSYPSVGVPVIGRFAQFPTSRAPVPPSLTLVERLCKPACGRTNGGERAHCASLAQQPHRPLLGYTLFPPALMPLEHMHFPLDARCRRCLGRLCSVEYWLQRYPLVGADAAAAAPAASNLTTQAPYL